MVVKEQVNEAPKKRGRPKGSKNKVKVVNTNLSAKTEMLETNFPSVRNDVVETTGIDTGAEVSGVKQKDGTKNKKEKSKNLNRKSSTGNVSKEDKRKDSKEDEIKTVDSEIECILDPDCEDENPHDEKISHKEPESDDEKSDIDKKSFDGKNDIKKRKKKSTAVYVNSIAGMVRYEESTLHREEQEKEITVEKPDSNIEVENESPEPAKEPNGIKVEGIFELSDQNGAAYGFLRQNGISSEDDIYVSPMFVKKFNLKSGELVRGYAKLEQTDRHRPITFLTDVNGVPPYTSRSKFRFDDMTPQFPKERFHLSKSTNDIAMRIIDLIAPVGKGQRGLIVAPPKSGKTILLQKIAKSIKRDYPEVELMILLIDERPEEVTDMKEEVDAAVYYSTFDELPMNHIRIAELVLNRARGLVEMGKDVVILLDSITRLARAYNIAMPASGRTLSGGLDTSALHKPKRFLGSARNMIEGGSLTIMATALIETGSKMDDVIFEEFKGTGNMELILDRKLSEKRIFPSIDIKRSGTRREELLLNREEYEAIMKLRRALDQTSGNEPVELLSEELMRTKDNAELIAWINKVFVDSKFGKMR